MITDRNRIFDGWLTLEGGVDAGRLPDTLDVNQAQSAINMTFRGGTAKTRPGFRKLYEQFNLPYTYSHKTHQWGTSQLWCYGVRHAYSPDDVRVAGQFKMPTEPIYFLSEPPPPPPPAPHPEVLPWFVNQNSEYIYRNGVMQGACLYSPHHGHDCIMAMIDGRLFRIIPGVKGARVNEVVIHGKERDLRNMKRYPVAYMVQADKFLVIQDGLSAAIIYDGKTARRSDTSGTEDETEIPTGTLMAYGMGRLVVVVNDRDVAFGDLYGSHDRQDPADSLILFTERNFLAEGFDAAIPFTQGLATGMMFFPQQDTSTGNGQLIVFAERGATNFFLSIPRELWKTSSFQILSLLTTGLRGHRAISVVNEDLWFRSDDGMRTYRQARSDSEKFAWAHIPLSTNVRQYLENDSEQMLKFCSSIYFDNRILVTTSPRWNQGRPAHTGMVVVDFDILSSFSGSSNVPQATKPAWEGYWDCPQFLPVQIISGIFNGITRAFVLGLDNNGQNQLYELSRDDHDDFNDDRINWELVTRSFDFTKLSQDSTVFTENELYDGDLWLKQIIE